MAQPTELIATKTQYFLSQYFVISIRVLSYCSGLFFFGTITPYLNIILPDKNIRTLLILGVNIIEFEVISYIVKKVYKPKFDRQNLTEYDYNYRYTGEKMIYQLLCFFILNFIFSVVCYNLSGLDSKYTILAGLGAGGIIVSFFHLAGVAILMTMVALRLKYTFSQKLAMLIVSLMFMLPGLFYIFMAMYSQSLNFSNLL